jgi:hypothetical protein
VELGFHDSLRRVGEGMNLLTLLLLVIVVLLLIGGVGYGRRGRL